MRTDPFKAAEVFIPRGPLPEEFALHGIDVTHYFVGDQYAKLFHVPAGKMIGQHRHRFPHPGVLLLGHAAVKRGSEVQLLHAPAQVIIEANEVHEITALTDCLWACLWPNPDGITDPQRFDHEVIA